MTFVAGADVCVDLVVNGRPDPVHPDLVVVDGVIVSSGTWTSQVALGDPFNYTTWINNNYIFRGACPGSVGADPVSSPVFVAGDCVNISGEDGIWEITGMNDAGTSYMVTAPDGAHWRFTVSSAVSRFTLVSCPGAADEFEDPWMPVFDVGDVLCSDQAEIAHWFPQTVRSICATGYVCDTVTVPMDWDPYMFVCSGADDPATAVDPAAPGLSSVGLSLLGVGFLYVLSRKGGVL